PLMSFSMIWLLPAAQVCDDTGSGLHDAATADRPSADSATADAASGDGATGCGAQTCGAHQICVLPCCGGPPPECIPANDAGVCPYGPCPPPRGDPCQAPHCVPPAPF